MGFAAVLKLKEVFTDEQTAALAELFDKELVTKTDLRGSTEKLSDMIDLADTKIVEQSEKLASVATKNDVALEVEKLRREIETMRGETNEKIEILRGETNTRIESVKTDLVRWVVGMGLATIGILFALLRFLPSP